MCFICSSYIGYFKLEGGITKSGSSVCSSVVNACRHAFSFLRKVNLATNLISKVG
jgi:hypothetical protein